MMNLEEFIASGILELYVLGDTSDEETAEVLIMLSKFPAEIAHEIEEISTVLEKLALENAVEPSAKVKESLFAKLNELGAGKSAAKSSVQKGAVLHQSRRPAAEIPLLTHFSKIEDYTDWFSPEDLVMPEGFAGVHLKMLGHTEKMTTMLIIATAIEGEVHHDLYEKLLVIEGTCNVIVEGKVHTFQKGDYINIPLHKWHDVMIPDGTVCKAILQRIPV